MKYKRSVYRTLSLVSQLGISMIAPILLCTYVGVWLEEKTHLPLALPLMILGILAGGRNVYTLARHANEDSEDKEEMDDEG